MRCLEYWYVGCYPRMLFCWRGAMVEVLGVLVHRLLSVTIVRDAVLLRLL